MVKYLSEATGNNGFDGVIDGFKHVPGVHCTSSAVRDVFEFHGWKMSEARVFGLGSGMTLGYLKIPRMVPFFGGRNKDFVVDLCSSLSISLNEFKTKNPVEGWDRLKQRLDKRRPSVINIDMAYLTYQKANLPSDDYHFGGHTITVCGYNSEKETVLVADTHFATLHEISVQELEKGRNSTIDRFMAPNNLIYEFDFPKRIPELSTVLEDVLNRNGNYLISKSNRMLRLIGIHSGTTAIDVLIKDLDHWLRQSDEKLSYRCMQQAGYIGTKDYNFGTGGGLFRYLFSEFLKECFIELNIASLQQLSTFYEQLGKKWETCAELFLQIGKDPDRGEITKIINQIKHELLRIKQLEEEGANRLLGFDL